MVETKRKILIGLIKPKIFKEDNIYVTLKKFEEKIYVNDIFSYGPTWTTNLKGYVLQDYKKVIQELKDAHNCEVHYDAFIEQSLNAINKLEKIATLTKQSPTSFPL